MEKIKVKIKSAGKMIVIPVLVVLVLIATFIYNASIRENESIISNAQGTYVLASGTIENNTIAISSQVIGTVEEMLVSEGDKIEEGDTILSIDSSNLRNQVEQAEYNLKLAEANVKSLETNLANLQTQNQDMINQANSAYKAAQSEYQRVVEGASAEEIKIQETVVDQAMASLEFLGENLENSQVMLENGGISQAAYDEAEYNYNTVSSQHDAAVARLDMLKGGPSSASKSAAENKMLQAKASYELAISNGNTQASQLTGQLEAARLQSQQAETMLEQMQNELNKSIVTSPIDGIVNSIFIDEGEFTTAGRAIAEVYDPDNIEARIYVAESNIGFVKVGQEVDVYGDHDEDKAFSGQVIRINNVAEFTPKNIQTKEERVNTVFEVTLKIEDVNGELKPGMPVDVNIKIDQEIE